MTSIPRSATFRGINAAGLLLPTPAEVTALSLLFEKVFLPTNLEIVVALAKRYKVAVPPDLPEFLRGPALTYDDGDPTDPLAHLTVAERKRALDILTVSIASALQYRALIGPVFETADQPADLFDFDIRDFDENADLPQTITIHFKNLGLTVDPEEFSGRVAEGYLPVVFHAVRKIGTASDPLSMPALASMLAMAGLTMVLPGMRAARPDEILEARHRLRDHLPVFWSAMLKLSVDLRAIGGDQAESSDWLRHARDVVDVTVRPALLDLQHKLELERRDWAFKILSSVQKGFRLLVGHPPVTQQQMITSALVLGADLAVTAAENIRTIEALKQGAGLTFLIEAEKAFPTAV